MTCARPPHAGARCAATHHALSLLLRIFSRLGATPQLAVAPAARTCVAAGTTWQPGRQRAVPCAVKQQCGSPDPGEPPPVEFEVQTRPSAEVVAIAAPRNPLLAPQTKEEQPRATRRVGETAYSRTAATQYQTISPHLSRTLPPAIRFYSEFRPSMRSHCLRALQASKPALIALLRYESETLSHLPASRFHGSAHTLWPGSTT